MNYEVCFFETQSNAQQVYTFLRHFIALPALAVVIVFAVSPGADLGFIKGGLTQGTNLLGRGV